MTTATAASGAKPPKVTPKEAPAKKASAKKAAAKKVAAPDVFAGLAVADPLKIGSIRSARGLADVIAESTADAISSSFPTDALGSLETSGRHATGFRLDSGSVRLMWLTARRIETSEGKPGFEISFFAQGAAIQSFRSRLEELGAKKASFSFSAADVLGKDGKARLRQKSSSWSPSAKDALKLASPGNWSVELNHGQPEALRGAMRIRVFGTDAQASKALAEVQKKVGLQGVFAPPTPAALDRLKKMRLIWQEAPQALERLRFRPFAEVSTEEIDAALHAAGIGAQSQGMKAVDAASLMDPAIKKRVQLSKLLLETSPRRFVDWVSSDYYAQHGILPTSSYSSDWSLESALSQADVGNGTAAYKKALGAAAPKVDDARRVLRFGLLAKQDKEAAAALISRDLSDVSSQTVNALLKEQGIAPTSARLKNLRFQEVYPGYFTVVDPSAPERLYKAGARYLYSTADNVDRVMSILTGGQKASLTRFSEGLLVQGKSSDSDFGTGGAFAVFTRLVTKSAVANGKQGGWNGAFNNWGGSRPYKVILSRDILARTDWWGYTSDNYGRSTGLKADNHGEKLVRAIDKSYSSSNELMFPVGNDPAFIEYVVCETEDQKKKLIDRMAKDGIEHWRGRPLGEFVRVTKSFFELPEDEKKT